MPYCGCFHQYQLSQTGTHDFSLHLKIEGTCKLKAILDRTGVIASVAERQGVFNLGSLEIRGVRAGFDLTGLLELLKSTIFVDLAPELDECYSLGPFTCFDENGSPQNAPMGHLLHRAKYSGGAAEANQLSAMLGEFVRHHPNLNRVRTVVSPPKSDKTTPDLPGVWAQSTAAMLGMELMTVRKLRYTTPRKTVDDDEVDPKSVELIAGSMKVDEDLSGSAVLVLDDTIGDGGTLKEVGRALRETNAANVYGLVATKNARRMQGGIELSIARWT